MDVSPAERERARRDRVYVHLKETERETGSGVRTPGRERLRSSLSGDRQCSSSSAVLELSSPVLRARARNAPVRVRVAYSYVCVCGEILVKSPALANRRVCRKVDDREIFVCRGSNYTEHWRLRSFLKNPPVRVRYVCSPQGWVPTIWR